MRNHRLAAAALLAAAFAASVPALRAEEPVPPPKPAAPAAPAAPATDEARSRKEAKVRKMFELSRWDEQVLSGMDAAFEQQEKLGVLPKKFAKKFREAADMEALKAIAVDIFSDLYDEETLDGLIAFLETPAGRKYSAANLRLMAVVQEKITPWAMETAGKVMAEAMENPEEGEDEGAIVGNLKDAKRSANETAAIATLRNLASCQAHIQASGKIDSDNDGIGEYGTFLELTGSVGVRKGPATGTPASADFTAKGTPVNPPIMSKALSNVGPDGVVRKSGYCFRIYLPDSENPSGFVHESGPADAVALAGGTGRVSVDMVETTWCAYAWPETLGASGSRAFFVNQAGDVVQSSNEKAQWAGEKGPPGNAAFVGAGITGQVAVGTAGRDGDVWKVVN